MVDTVPREVGGSLHLLGHHPVSTLHLRGDKASAGLPRECSAACTPGSSGALGPLHPHFLGGTRPSTPPVPCEHSATCTPGSLGALSHLCFRFPVSTWPSTSLVPREHSAVYAPSPRQVLGPLYASLHSRSLTSLRFTVSGSEHRSRCI